MNVKAFTFLFIFLYFVHFSILSKNVIQSRLAIIINLAFSSCMFRLIIIKTNLSHRMSICIWSSFSYLFILSLSFNKISTNFILTSPIIIHSEIIFCLIRKVDIFPTMLLVICFWVKYHLVYLMLIVRKFVSYFHDCVKVCKFWITLKAMFIEFWFIGVIKNVWTWLRWRLVFWNVEEEIWGMFILFHGFDFFYNFNF